MKKIPTQKDVDKYLANGDFVRAGITAQRIDPLGRVSSEDWEKFRRSRKDPLARLTDKDLDELRQIQLRKESR